MSANNGDAFAEIRWAKPGASKPSPRPIARALPANYILVA